MARTLTASDRRSLIRLASAMPVGSPERKAILKGLTKATERTAGLRWDPDMEPRDEGAWFRDVLKGYAGKFGGRVRGKRVIDFPDAVGGKARSTLEFRWDRDYTLKTLVETHTDPNGTTVNKVVVRPGMTAGEVVRALYDKAMEHNTVSVYMP